eukprot:m.316756 g.316756  ORF g.316756 m.316756 type:complete len:107 (+) comp16428_c0_seq1:284-604(+)
MATGKHGDVEELRVRGAVSPAFAAIVAAFRQGDAVETVDLQFQGIGVEQVKNLSQAIARHGRMNATPINRRVISIKDGGERHPRPNTRVGRLGTSGAGHQRQPCSM